ncbi:carbohydrate ABC transporter permease [Paenibacillus sp. IB182496]|uniref:Carbohydrate ABC transporter permease n=1 Tax=Paenibacillus sabuli TaxID=2772509 RepID=A0A927GRY6_9BACL|nr:carbohydrate ABC transporter permease [Paenibacillus sabuli]MBD2845475.1 carbohydrate ABC transporter permease [Paenibacillus sabuli]
MSNKSGKIKSPTADRILKITAYSFTVLFSLLLLYPLLYTISNSVKDHVRIYDVPPKTIPEAARSLSIVLDYSELGAMDDRELLDLAQRDNILAMFSTLAEYPRDSLFEIKTFGVKEGKTIFYSRAHKMKLELLRDFGVYRGSVVKADVLLHGDRYVRASDAIGYEFDSVGLPRQPEASPARDEFDSRLTALFADKYKLEGFFSHSTLNTNNVLLLENYWYYFQLPSYVYSNNELIAQYSFLTFVFNTLLVIGWAIVTQVVLCSLSAFVISRLLDRKAGNAVLLYFLGAMMIPFASIMLPQLVMYKEIGFYDNYGALLLPFLYPFGFFVYLFKGFFDQIPSDYFEAARMDGASNLYLFAKICMPLSKPIITLIVLQTFIGNWNDFFWAWLVTEKQHLWTINVALYSLSINGSTKQNFILGLSVLMTLPVILMTVISSRQLKQSVMGSGVKG